MIKTFEREVKKLAGEFKNYIEEYNFKQYDFYSIRQTLLDMIKDKYPDYNNYVESDYVQMLLDLFAYYGEMMAYRMDVNLNEAFLGTATERENIIKIAHTLGYNYRRIIPAKTIFKIDMTEKEANLIRKISSGSSIESLINESNEITFELVKSSINNYYPYKLDYLFKEINGISFLNVVNNVFEKLEDFNINDNIKTYRKVINGTEYNVRSYIISDILTRIEPNSNIYVTYFGEDKMMEIQSLVYDKQAYLTSNNIEDAFDYDQNRLYDFNPIISFECELIYDDGGNIIDKNLYMLMIVVQGGSFTYQIQDYFKEIPNYEFTLSEPNIFQDSIVVRCFDVDGNLMYEYKQVEDITNTNEKYAFEVVNTPEGFVKLLFGDGKKTNMLKPTHKILVYYRKNPQNTDEIFNFTNIPFETINFYCEYFDKNLEKSDTYPFAIPFNKSITIYGGMPEETDDEIKRIANKIRVIANRFVTSEDYKYAGLLHPKVKYTGVKLRDYIGRNRSRINSNFIDVYFDKNKLKIEIFNLYNIYNNEHIGIFMYVPDAEFTLNSIDKDDYIKFVSNGEEYYFEIFDIEKVPIQDYISYPSNFIDVKNKGKIIEIKNRKIDNEKFNKHINKEIFFVNILKIKEISNVSDVKFNFRKKELSIIIDANVDVENLDKKLLIELLNEYFDSIDLSEFDLKIKIKDFITIKKINENEYQIDLIYETNINYDENDLSFVWTHYISDDIYINPSKSNIIEIYVVGYERDLINNVDRYVKLTPFELNVLKKRIEERKMVTDVVYVYNSKVYEIKIALKIRKKRTAYISNDVLYMNINKTIDKFFDLNNLQLGKHFYASQLIEKIHNDNPEVESVELLTDENGKTITPVSTLDIIGDEIVVTQIVETYKSNGKPDRIIIIE
jgi:hypothetical protein